MPLDPVIPVSTLRVWRGSHRDRARGRDDTPRGMRRRTRTRSRSRRSSPCQGVRLDIVRCAAIPVRERVRVRGGAFAFAAARSRSRRRVRVRGGVRLDMRGGLGITAWRAMWPLWLHRVKAFALTCAGAVAIAVAVAVVVVVAMAGGYSRGVCFSALKRESAPAHFSALKCRTRTRSRPERVLGASHPSGFR